MITKDSNELKVGWTKCLFTKHCDNPYCFTITNQWIANTNLGIILIERELHFHSVCL